MICSPAWICSNGTTSFGKNPTQMLDLVRPIYEKTASYGHFGREEPEFTWEATDKAAILREAAGIKGDVKRFAAGD